MKRYLPISRPCYDKPHRCPGRRGGGMRYGKVEQCYGGAVKLYGHKWWQWRFNRCDSCHVLVLPYAVRWLDPGWLRYWRPYWYHQWKSDRRQSGRHRYRGE